MVFRNDDVNPNSNIKDIQKMYALIKKYFPKAKIYSCITIFAKKNSNGSAYPKIEIHDIDYPNIDIMFDLKNLPVLENIVSHGLFHIDHRNSSKDLQTFSIVSSAKLLKTNRFIPPFWRWNKTTQEICDENNISLWIKQEKDWISLDTGNVDKKHDHYLFHSWKFTPESFEAKLKIL
jgi:hypothetical protein